MKQLITILIILIITLIYIDTWIDKRDDFKTSFPVFPGSAIWKAFFFTPDFYPENSSACFHTHICFCIKPFITFHDPPLLYDLSRDPSESTPLSPDTEPQFYSVLEVIRAAVSRHTQSLKPVPLQLSPLQMIWKPWLQPCCSSLSQLCRCERDHQIEKLRHELQEE